MSKKRLKLAYELVISRLYLQLVTNILFMKKNSTLLELSAKDDEDFFNGFYILANMLEHNYLYQKCAIGQNSFIQDSHHSSLNVDLERLERNIKIMLNNNNV
jgi:hypothetical protein